MENFPTSNAECVKQFEARKGDSIANLLSEGTETYKTIQPQKNNTTRPAPPILGAGGVKKRNKQFTLKLK